jgi:hypothetical protein
VRPGGRIMGPASVAVPAGLDELARDARGWVAARHPDAGAVPVTLSRRGG